MEKMNPASMPPPVSNAYAQIVVTPPGRTAYISGQIAHDTDGELVGPGDYGAQAKQCFLNIAGALEALGAKPSQIAKMTINVVNHRAELRELIFPAGREVFGDDWPVCASILLGVQALSRPQWLVEVDAIVHLSA